MSSARRMSVAWLWLAPLLLVVLVALIQWLPLLTLADPWAAATVARPYTPLELLGRDIYLREGCGVCHSQLVRTLEPDIRRFGWPDGAAASYYDHPTVLGGRRYGPDLATIGGRLPDSWLRRYLRAPRSVATNSSMPVYARLAAKRLNYADLPERLRLMRRLGVPYSLARSELDANSRRFGVEMARYYDILHAEAGLVEQARRRDYDGDPARITEMDALIAYIQSLGQRLPSDRTTAPEDASGIAAQKPVRGS